MFCKTRKTAVFDANLKAAVFLFDYNYGKYKEFFVSI